MKVNALGVQRRFGLSQRTNNNYDMAQLLVMQPLTGSTSANSTFQAAGFRVLEFNLEPSKIGEFMALTFPLELEVETEARPSSRGVDTYITGIKNK